MIRFLHVKIFIKNAPIRILIARESALCQPLCSLTFEMRERKRGKKNQTRAWGGHWSLRPVRGGRLRPSFGKEAEMCAWLLGHTEVLNEKHVCIKGLIESTH